MQKRDYLEPGSRKKILLLSDDFRFPSGVGTMAKEIIINTAHHFNWVNIGAAINHPDLGKVLDLNNAINEEAGISDAQVKIYPSNGYGDSTMLRKILSMEQPNAIMMFTDPRYWFWLFNMEREIRTKIPIMYYNIWDNLPYPMYNRPYYMSCDGLFGISKQTVNINRVVLGDAADEKVIKYIPHGVSKKFFPIAKDDPKVVETRNRVLGPFANDTDFVLLFNARNLGRKKVSDLILAWDKCVTDGKVGPKSCLVLHTDPVDNAGTDLPAVVRDCVNPTTRIVIDSGKCSTEDLNLLYNISDGVILVSSAEGWGLSLTEALVTGKMIIAPVSGGMQDQMRFRKEDGSWIDFTKDFPSNHTGLVRVCGEWAIPMLPSVRHCVGSPVTPYIFDDQVNTDDIAEAIGMLYNIDPQERQRRGEAGREWAISDEAGFTAQKMGERMIEGIEEVFRNFEENPRSRYEFFKVDDRPSNKVNYNVLDYKL